MAILLLWAFAAILDGEPPGWREGFPAWSLPVAVLALYIIDVLPFLRPAMLNQLTSEHVRLARLRGLPVGPVRGFPRTRGSVTLVGHKTCQSGTAT